MKLFQFCALIFAGLLLAGCAEKKKTNDIIIQKVETPKPQGPIRMQEYTQQRDVKWLGRNYKVEIRRVADDSLRMVKDETGQKFIDNRIFLRIIRSDGTVFFSRSFTKAAFDDYLNDDYRQTGILEGFVFDKVDGQRLVFAASVCHPQTDEYIPLVVYVDNLGAIGIRLDTELDTSGSLAPDEDEDGV